MVDYQIPHLVSIYDVSVLALSSRFDGRCRHGGWKIGLVVSVLALSSRFDGPKRAAQTVSAAGVSVLALSSRFDGHEWQRLRH